MNCLIIHNFSEKTINDSISLGLNLNFFVWQIYEDWNEHRKVKKESFVSSTFRLIIGKIVIHLCLFPRTISGNLFLYWSISVYYFPLPYFIPIIYTKLIRIWFFVFINTFSRFYSRSLLFLYVLSVVFDYFVDINTKLLFYLFVTLFKFLNLPLQIIYLFLIHFDFKTKSHQFFSIISLYLF